MTSCETDDLGLRLWDVSQPLRIGIPIWPGDTPYGEQRTATISADCPINVSRITLSTHTGTHADGRLHYNVGGDAIGGAELRPYIGRAQLMTVNSQDGFVATDEVLAQMVPGIRRILLRTFDAFPLETWRSDFAAVAPELVDGLADRGCILIGIDSPSLDPETAKSLDAHAAVARRGLAILEGLLFDGVCDGIYELIALPLRLTTADASPVRALLRELPNNPGETTLA